MKKNVLWKLILVSIILGGIFCNSFSVQAETTTPLKKVKIAIYSDEGFYNINEEKEVVGGFAYDYIQALNRYMHWDIEYYYTTWENCLQLVKDKEVDLTVGVYKTKEREELYEFNEYPFLLVYDYLVGEAEDQLIYQISDLDNKRIGYLNKSKTRDKLQAYIDEYDLNIQLIPSDETEQLFALLDNGEIDYFLSSTTKLDDEHKVLMNVSEEELFIIGNEDSKEFLADFDQAILANNQDDFGLFDKLLQKNYDDFFTSYKDVISLEDKLLLKDKPAIKCGILAENSSYYAIGKAIATEIQKELLDKALIEMEIVKYPSEAALLAAMENNEIQLIAQFPFDYYQADLYNVDLTSYYMQQNLLYLANVYSQNTTSNIGVVQDELGVYELIRQKFPETEFEEYASMQACIDAINSGLVKGAIVPNFYFSNNNELDGIDDIVNQAIPGKTIAISMAMSKTLADVYLINIDKVVRNIDETVLMQEIIAEFKIQGKQEVSALIEDYYWQLVILVLSIIGVILFLALLNQYKRQQNDKLIKANQELEQAKAMALLANQVKDNFLANMSHDMRTPLGAVISIANFGEIEADDTKLINYFKDIKRDASYLLALLNDILDIQKINNQGIEFRRKPTNLNEVVEKVSAIMQPMFKEKNQQFNYSANIPHDLIVNIDANRLVQVLINLLTNACKYTLRKGTINWYQDVKIVDDDAYLTIVVEDNGIGMSEEFQARMFEAFARENQTVQEGVGLGLAIIAKIIEAGDATISWESKLSQGTKFTLNFKVKVVSKLTTAKEDYSSLANLKVLVAEDTAINIKIIKKILEKQGMLVDIATNGQQAVVKVQHHEYDVVLMDMRMPVLDGIEATKQIRKFKPKLPIIAISANVRQEDQQMTKEAGMNYHLAKPIDADKLYHVIQQLVKITKNDNN